jgi:heme A synthase
MAAVLCFQIALGVLTALYQAPIPLAIAHQLGAFVLACSTTLLLHRYP